ncbi:unnamed protein product [Clavelina lepadiformis]|uniref:Mitochondrial uncoupling protein 4 n=1 Tax=Clavelina lepadiformis TaxID=159417 RepID=A0ABP0GWY9_CLALP
MFNELQLTCIKFASSAAASAIAETATFPLDLTKTRLQIQGEVASNGHASTMVKRGMIRTAFGVVCEEGVSKLWTGLPPAVYRHIIYTGVRMIVYEQMRENVLGRNKDGSFSVWKAAIAGLCAGSVGQFVASPMDLVKVKMQMKNHRMLGNTEPNFTNVCHALRSTYHANGIKGLWAGWVPNVQRAALVNVGNLTTYDVAKQYILRNTRLKDNWFCHMLASICSGFVAAVLGTPADVVKTRMMNQARDSNGRGLFYKSSVDCVVTTVKQEGFLSLYKGFIPIWSRIAPWSVIFWITNEEIRKLIGISTF